MIAVEALKQLEAILKGIKEYALTAIPKNNLDDYRKGYEDGLNSALHEVYGLIKEVQPIDRPTL